MLHTSWMLCIKRNLTDVHFNYNHRSCSSGSLESSAFRHGFEFDLSNEMRTTEIMINKAPIRVNKEASSESTRTPNTAE